MRSDREIKLQAKEVVSKHYWITVGFGLLATITAAKELYSRQTELVESLAWFIALFGFDVEFNFTAIALPFGTIMVPLISYVLFNPIQVGAKNAFRFLSYNDETYKETIHNVFSGERYLKVVAVELIKVVFTVLGFFCFIIPGVILTFRYYFVDYLVYEYPEEGVIDILKMSGNLTKGHKLDLFMFELSFIGWMLLSVLTCGLVQVFYFNGYHEAAIALLFEEYINENIGDLKTQY